MPSIQRVLPIFRDLDGATLSAHAFAAACVKSGWPEPVGDGIGLWDVEHPSEGTNLDTYSRFLANRIGPQSH